jgi:hypothetical protein
VRATKDHLKSPKIDNGIVDVDGLEFEIRPLSRKRQIEVQEAREQQGLAYADALVLHYGLVDPALTLEEAQEWQDDEGQGAVVSAVSQGIGVISGMMADSGKAAYKSVGRRPGA